METENPARFEEDHDSGDDETPSEGNTSAATQKGERPLADKVENTIRALLNFVRSYLHTLRFALSPKTLPKFSAGLPVDDALLIRPLTFLCCSFIPAAVILDLASETIWDVLLAPEQAAARIGERLQTISPLKIALGAIPALIAVYLGASLLSKMAVRQRERRGSYVDAMCYSFGVQFFGMAVLVVIVLLGHTRIATQFVPAPALNMVVDVLTWTGAFYLILLGAVAYPFIVSARLIREFHVPGERPRRILFSRILLSMVGVAVITIATYWLGILPSKFREATVHEEKVAVGLTEERLQIVDGAPPVLDMRIRIANPAAKLILVPADTGLTVRLRLSAGGQVIPPNSFPVEFLNAQGAPFVTLRPNDATWIAGRIHPDGNDWQLLDNNRAKGGSIALELSLHDDDGNRVSGAWLDVSLAGAWPELPPNAKPQNASPR